MADLSTTAKNKIGEASDAVSQAASRINQRVKDSAEYVAEMAKEAAGNASKGAAKTGAYLDDRAEEATAAVGGGLKAAGDAVRQNAPREGRLGQASSAVAQTLTNTGSYLEREGLEGIACDITTLIKKNPVPALLIGIGLGYLFARASTSKV